MQKNNSIVLEIILLGGALSNDPWREHLWFYHYYCFFSDLTLISRFVLFLFTFFFPAMSYLIYWVYGNNRSRWLRFLFKFQRLWLKPYQEIWNCTTFVYRPDREKSTVHVRDSVSLSLTLSSLSTRLLPRGFHKQRDNQNVCDIPNTVVLFAIWSTNAIRLSKLLKQ